MIYITRRERFSSTHRLYRADWDDQKNMEIFGPCSNKNGHGHNFELFVTIKGKVNPDNGFVMNLKALSPIIKDKVCLLYTSPSPRDPKTSRMPSSA